MPGEQRSIRALGKRTSAILRRYYLGPDHPMKLRLWGWLRRRSGYPRPTIRYDSAGWITVDERDLLQRKIFVTGFYESEVWEALFSLAVSDEVVWDVGAHIGSFSIRALLDRRVKELHAFEPDPIHAEILAINLALNDPAKERHILHRLALSDRTEIKKLYHGPDANTGLSSLVMQLRDQVFDVPCQRADELVFHEGVAPPTIVKIDVEGWEAQVFFGAQRLLVEIPPKAIVFEAEYREPDQIGDHSLACWLESLGYKIRHIKRPSGVVEERENFLAVHRTCANLSTAESAL